MRNRLVFIGDSITDGHTLVLHVEQALAALGDARDCYNLGVAGDRADQMLSRLEREVLPLLSLESATVCLSAGINDAMQGVLPSVYRDNLASLIRQITASGARVIVLTPTAVAPQHPAARALVTAYRDIIVELARAPGVSCADVGAAMAAAQAAGAAPQLSPDGIHLEEPGYCAMAVTVLAALGHPHVTLPPRPRWEALPGLLTPWRIALVDQPAQVSLECALPEALACPAWWEAQEQARGYARAFIARLPGSAWIAEATLPPGPAGWLVVGGQIQCIAINEVECPHAAPYNGWHVRPVIPLPASVLPRRLSLRIAGPFTAAFQSSSNTCLLGSSGLETSGLETSGP